MVYVGCGLLNEVEEVHRESKAVLCLVAQIRGGDINLRLTDKFRRLSDRPQSSTYLSKPVKKVVYAVDYAF